LAGNDKNSLLQWRVIVVGGHTRSIGKTQLVCDVISAFPQANWIAGKITQYGHGVCARNGENCDCAPDEHVCAINWEVRADTGTDSARFLAAGARRSFWLRTKQGYLAEGLPLLRAALKETLADVKADLPPLIVESNSLLQFLKPSLYFSVIDRRKMISKIRHALLSTGPMRWCFAGLPALLRRKDLPGPSFLCACSRKSCPLRSARVSLCQIRCMCSFNECWKGLQAFQFDNAQLRLPHLSR